MVRQLFCSWQAVVLLMIMLSSTKAPVTVSAVTVATHQHTLLVDGKPFFMKGVVYSPTPIGMSPSWYPFGDWFLNQYVELWERDFPILREMGVNTIRILGWDLNADHTFFLNKLDEYGLKVIIQYNLHNAYSNPIHDEWQRQNILGTFKWQVSRYLGHPAILAWNFGVDLNGAWAGWLQGFNDAFGCSYNAGQWPYDPNGCYFNPDTTGGCAHAAECVYQHLFEFLNTAALYAKDAMGPSRPHLIFSSFADVDLVPLRLSMAEKYAPAIDAWGQSIYRGKDFGTGDGDFIASYAASSSKPLIITEYGVDAYNDPCGDSTTSPCYNNEYQPPRGYGEAEEMQAEWDAALTQILFEHSSAHRRGPVAGGMIMSYVDEAWKGSMGVRGCWGPIPYGKPGFDPSQCEYKAHVTCPQADLSHSSLCGYPTPATFDHYANTAWYGIMAPSLVENDQNKLRPRLVYAELKKLWAGPVGNTWMYLTILCFVISFMMLLYIYTRWRRRLNELQQKSAGPPVPLSRALSSTMHASPHLLPKQPSLQNKSPTSVTTSTTSMPRMPAPPTTDERTPLVAK